MNHLTAHLLVCTVIIYTVESYKILVFAPKFGVSHMKFLIKVADTLVDAGHNVVLQLAQKGERKSLDAIQLNIRETIYSPNVNLDVKPMTAKARIINADLGLALDMESNQRLVWSNKLSSYLELGKAAMKPVRKLLKSLYASREFHTWIREQNFDLAISEGVIFIDALLYTCGIQKFIIATSTNPTEMILERMGIPSTPSFVPVNNKGFSVPMSYIERAQNFLEFTFMDLLFRLTLFPEFNQYLWDQFGPTWSLEKQVNAVSYIFVNNDEMIDFPRVTTPKFHYIGGLRMPPPKPLEKEWEQIFASSKRGVVLMSFGTMARGTEMGEKRRQAFVRAFEAFPDITFIWKYENTTDRFTSAKNIILHDWLPQVDMLNDKRMLAFITHGGMGGVFETAYAGVPVITIPLFADQLRNARMMEYRGVGLVIDKDDVSEKHLISSIKEILKPRYKEAAVRLSKQLRNKPFTPEEILVRYVEHAIRFNVSQSLSSAITKQSFIEYYMLDIIIPFSLVLLLIVALLLRFVYFLVSFLLRLVVRVKIAKVKQS